MAWCDSLVKHSEYGDELNADTFLTETVMERWEKEGGLIVGTMGLEHNARKPGWGGFAEFLGAYALEKGDPKLPKFEWEHNERDDHRPAGSTLTMQVAN